MELFDTTFEVPPGLIEEINKRNCIAFVGSGFTAPLVADWHTLLKMLLEDAKMEVDDFNASNSENAVEVEESFRLLMERANKLKGASSAEYGGTFFPHNLFFLKACDPLFPFPFQNASLRRSRILLVKRACTLLLHRYCFSDLLRYAAHFTVCSQHLAQKRCKLDDNMIISNLMKARMEALSRIPFKAIITTNYNNCFSGNIATLHGDSAQSHFEAILRPLKDSQQSAHDVASKAEVLGALSPSPPRGDHFIHSSASPPPESGSRDDVANSSDILDCHEHGQACKTPIPPGTGHPKPDEPSDMTLAQARAKCAGSNQPPSFCNI
jgi:hypothetical protein